MNFLDTPQLPVVEQRNLTVLEGENTNLGQRELVLNTENAPTHNASSHGCQHYPGYLLLLKLNLT